MIYGNILLTVKDPANIETVAELLQEQARLSREEPGCERFEVYHSQADRQVFLLVERWESQAALDAHREAWAYLNVYQPKVIPLVDRVAHLSDLIG
jgi:autoinducer 2-degrading protein